MAAIRVTEPNVGSDVASVQCARAEASVDGGGWLHHRREGVVHVRRPRRRDRAARAHRSDSGKGAPGLSLFIVDKPRFDGHEFENASPAAARSPARPIARPAIAACTRYVLELR